MPVICKVVLLGGVEAYKQSLAVVFQFALSIRFSVGSEEAVLMFPCFLRLAVTALNEACFHVLDGVPLTELHG